MNKSRPALVFIMALFFSAGALISLASAVALLFPGGPLNEMWRLNPRAHEHFARMSFWAPLLLCIVSLLCATAGIGLWQLKLWGYWLAVALLLTNLIGDTINVIAGIEPRAIIGIPIVLLILFLLGRKNTRAVFR